MSQKSIPIYDLYGEAHSGRGFGAIHVETLHVRAQVNSWNILAHRHAALSQIFVIVTGGGMVDIDGTRHDMRPPAAIWLPAGIVHAFRFEPETNGAVVTLTDDVVRQSMALAPDCAAALAAPCVVHALPAAQRDLFMAHAEALAGETANPAPGVRAACLHHVGLMLVQLARAAAPDATTPITAARSLHRAFCDLVDQHFREHWSIPAYARRLGIGADRLHDACRTAAGRAPSEIIHDRVMVEARRALVYTAMSVAGVAYDLGFEDPAYFSRFFARRAGQSPAAFRKAAAFTIQQG